MRRARAAEDLKANGCSLDSSLQLREMTELAERTEIVANSPALDNFAVLKSKELHCCGVNLLAGRRHSHVTDGVSRRRRVASDNHVALGHHGLDLNIEVGQHCSEHGHDAFNIFWPASRERISSVMAHVVRRDNFICDRKIAAPPQLLAPASRRGLVLFDEHGPSLCRVIVCFLVGAFTPGKRQLLRSQSLLLLIPARNPCCNPLSRL